MKISKFKQKTGLFKLGYYVFEPETSNTEKVPLIVFLHGAGERGNGDEDLEFLKRNAMPNYISEGKEYSAIVLAPQCPMNTVWNNIVFELKELIDKVVLQYNIDTTKISITGISMGGFGSWEMGILFPDFFSAVGPVCGGGMSWRCGELKNTPVWALHGDADSVVPVRNSIEMVDAVNNNGGNARLTIFHGVEHCSWDDAYLNTNLVEWLITQKN